jgi:hypothetical protein
LILPLSNKATSVCKGAECALSPSTWNELP